MCFFVKKGQQPKILSQDMTVYKVGTIKHGFFHPIWKSEFKYSVGQPTIEVKLKLVNTDPDFEFAEIKGTDYDGIIMEGYHAWSDRKGMSDHKFYESVLKYRGEVPVIGQFTIPKGIQFYINIDDDTVVASQLIFKKLA